jgi:HEPN domain-containing protein
MVLGWVSHPWQPGRESWDSHDALPLRADDVLITIHQPSPPVTAEGLMLYADMSYLACRILFLASTTLHAEALYCASQVMEKYMKAILLTRGAPHRNIHALVPLAERLGGEFTDPEFLTLCARLQNFAVAGRYPDHRLAAWSYPLALLTFLDSFVVRCRRLANRPAASFNVIRAPLAQETQGNPVMEAAIRAVRDNNRYLATLVDP